MNSKTPLEALLKWTERFLARRPPKLIWGSFFSACMLIIVVGYLTGDKTDNLSRHLLLAFAVSLGALVLRWIERK